MDGTAHKRFCAAFRSHLSSLHLGVVALILGRGGGGKPICFATAEAIR